MVRVCVCVCRTDNNLDNIFAKLFDPCNSTLTSWVEAVRDQSKATKDIPMATP